MATRASLIEQDKQVLDRTMSLASNATSRLVPDLSKLSSQEAGGAVRTIATGLVDQFGNLAGESAAESYLRLRELGVTDFLARDMIRRGTAQRLIEQMAYTPKPIPVAVEKVVEPVVGQTMVKFSQGMFMEAQQYLAEGIARVVGNVYRETQTTNSERDQFASGYQRIASPTACAFCLVVTLNEYTSFDESGGYHDNCSCTAVPIFKGQSSYKPDYFSEFEDAYMQARFDSGSSKASDILAAIRVNTGRA